MAEISERLPRIRERLERSRRELVLMPDVFTASAELALVIAEISQISELLAAPSGARPEAQDRVRW